jgi:hypothetical protein
MWTTPTLLSTQITYVFNSCRLFSTHVGLSYCYNPQNQTLLRDTLAFVKAGSS